MIRSITLHIIAIVAALPLLQRDSPTVIQSYQAGEYFKFRVHYGVFNACYAELEVVDEQLKGRDVFHVKGKGKSTGMLDWFFKVDDRYETYIDKQSLQPLRFVRNIYEGGHTKDIVIDFDREENTALIHNKKKKKKKTMDIQPSTQDMVSSFYYLREVVDTKNIEPGDTFTVPMFFDYENYDFQLKFLKRETISTKFGRMPVLKFRPYVQAGRVFKEQESLTVWISDDQNKIPVQIKAKLAVGSLTASLDSFKGLKNSIKVLGN